MLCGKHVFLLIDIVLDYVNVRNGYTDLGTPYIEIASVSFALSCLIEVGKVALKAREARGDLAIIMMWLPLQRPFIQM